MANKSIKVLDFGCGAGEVVLAGVNEGIDIYGADIFQGEGFKDEALSSGLFGSRIFEIDHGKIDFGDENFDLIIANQVFEHVENLEEVVQEMTRLLKPNGKLLLLFPTIDTWVEQHCKIPFVHRMKNRKLQENYLIFMRNIGIGIKKDYRSHRQWANEFLIWMDNYCSYRSIKEISDLLSTNYSLCHIEDRYIYERLQAEGKISLSHLMNFPLIKHFAIFGFRKLGGFILIAEKNIIQ